MGSGSTTPKMKRRKRKAKHDARNKRVLATQIARANDTTIPKGPARRLNRLDVLELSPKQAPPPTVRRVIVTSVISRKPWVCGACKTNNDEYDTTCRGYKCQEPASWLPR